MGLTSRIDRRQAAFIALLAVLAGGLGVLSGAQPKLGLTAALGLVFAAAVLANLTLGLFLFTVLSFLEVINVGGSALSLMKVAGLLLFASWFASSSTRSARDTRSLIAAQPPMVAASVALISWSAISAVWAESAGATVTATQRYLLNLLLLPIVFSAIRRRQQLVTVIGGFVAGAAISAMYGMLASVGGRLTGGIGDPNEEAAVLVAALLLTPALFLSLPAGGRARPWSLAAGAVCALGLLTTASRGGLIAMGVALAAGVGLGGRWRIRMLALLIVGAASVGVYFTVLAPPSVRQHLASSNSTGRTDLWRVGWRMFAANPVNGVGAGNFPTAAIHYVQKAGPLTRADLVVNVPHVTHNLYLDVLDELGVPGLTMFLVIAGASLLAALRAARRFAESGDLPMEMMARMLLLGNLGVLVADFFLSGQYSKQLWLLLAIAAPLLAMAAPPSRSHPAR